MEMINAEYDSELIGELIGDVYEWHEDKDFLVPKMIF
jgi:hypothetical protein